MKFRLTLLALASALVLASCSKEQEVQTQEQEVCSVADITPADIEAMVHQTMVWIRDYQEWGYTLMNIKFQGNGVKVWVDYIYYDYYNPEFMGADKGTAIFFFDCDFNVTHYAL